MATDNIDWFSLLHVPNNALKGGITNQSEIFITLAFFSFFFGDKNLNMFYYMH